MPYINVNDAYILDNTGKQVDDAVDYALANSNRNLLDNPWFTVNQRNVSGTITSGYIADRWTITYGSGGVQASRTDNSVTVKSTSGSSHGDIAQRMEKSLFDFLLGKTVTASVMRSDGSVISKSFTFQSAANSIDVGTDLDGNAIAVRVYQTSTYQDVQFWKWKTAGTFRAVKLELGSYSTLANDVSPDYGEELRKCQYYYRRITVQDNGFIALGWATSATAAQFPNILGTSPMRAKPTATPTGAVYVRDPSGTEHAVSSFTVQYDPVAVCLQANTSGLTANTVARLRIGAGGRIDLSADL